MSTTVPNAVDLTSRLRAGISALVRRFQLAERADVACCGTTVAQAATLTALSDGPLRLGDLGARLGIAPSTLTRNLVRLVERGLVVTRPDPDDGRAARAELSPAGIDAAAAVERTEDEFIRSILARLPPDAAHQVVESLELLLAAVRDATRSCCPGAFEHLMTGPGWDRTVEEPHD